MNEHVKKWVAALRSGKYEQTREVLHDNQGFCCLGVICDVLSPNSWGDPDWDNRAYEFRTNEFGCEDDGVIDYPPPGMLEMLGIHDDFGNMLVRLNDEEHYNFSQIADVIERNVLSGRAFAPEDGSGLEWGYEV